MRLARSTSIFESARVLVLVLAALAIGLGAAVRHGDGLLTSLSAVLLGVVDVDWPRWIHNLADVLQIVTALFAFLLWGSTYREGAEPGSDVALSTRRRGRRRAAKSDGP
jgi:hypothetical protein